MTKIQLKAGVCTFALVILGASSAAWGQAAQAQTPAAAPTAGTGEIIVTALRRAERAQDVPAAISAIGGAALEQRQITGLTEALRQVPNMAVEQPYGEGGPPNFTIRGISSSDYSQNQSKPIAVYYDESPRNLQLFEIMPLYDVERIEILRGPQGTLYGRNATGGAVSILTRGPSFDNEGYITAGYGNFDTRRLQGAVNGEFVPDKIAARAAFFYQKDDGIYNNLAPGQKNFSQTDILSFRASLRFKPVDNFDATVRFSHLNSTGRNFLPLALNINTAALPALPGIDRAGVGFFESDSSDPGDFIVRTDRANLQMDWNVADYAIKSITSYDWGRWRTTNDSDGLPVDLVETEGSSRGWQFQQELRWVSTYQGPFNWQGGLSYYEDKVSTYSLSQLFTDPRLGGGGIVQSNSFDQKRSGEAVYARADYKILDQPTLHGGIRRSWDRLRGYNYDAYAGDPTGVAPVFLDEGIRRRFKNTSFEAGVDWKVVPDLLVYANYKEGYRMGAMNAAAFVSASEITIAAPEIAKSYEVGLKSQLLNRRLILNLALATTNYENQQIVSADETVIPGLVSIPSARIRSLELEAVLRPVNGVMLYGNLGLTDPKYTGESAVTGAIKGNRLINAAKVNATIGGSVDVIKVDAGTLTARANGNYISKRYFDRFNTEAIAQKGFWLADATLNWDGGRYSISANIKNIFNKKYINTATSFSSFLGFDIATRGEPRRYSVEATYRF